MQSIQAESEKERKQPVLVLGTIGYDAHIVGGWVLSRALEGAGFKVVYLGSSVSAEEFIDAAKETRADAILISSLYGMARIDCAGFKEKCREAGLEHVLLYIGGILITDPEKWEQTKKLFEAEGFNRVYPPGTRPATAIADLRRDLRLA